MLQSYATKLSNHRLYVSYLPLLNSGNQNVVMGYPPTNFGDITTFRFRFIGHRANTAQTDHVRLWPWPLTLDHGAFAWCGSSSFIRIPSLKIVSLAVRKIWHTMCVSINGPGDPDLWSFDLETGTWVAPKMGNLPSKLGITLSLWVLELFVMYATDGLTDR